MNRKELFVAPKQVGALTVIPCIMTIKSVNFLMGGLALFAAQGCKSPKQVAEQAEHPNIIYVFPDQYRNQAMGFWNQEDFRDKVNFRADPVHTPNLDAFVRDFCSKQLSVE